MDTTRVIVRCYCCDEDRPLDKAVVLADGTAFCKRCARTCGRNLVMGDARTELDDLTGRSKAAQ